MIWVGLQFNVPKAVKEFPIALRSDCESGVHRDISCLLPSNLSEILPMLSTVMETIYEYSEIAQIAATSLPACTTSHLEWLLSPELRPISTALKCVSHAEVSLQALRAMLVGDPASKTGSMTASIIPLLSSTYNTSEDVCGAKSLPYTVVLPPILARKRLQLDIVGDLQRMVCDWTSGESDEGRRLVNFQQVDRIQSHIVLAPRSMPLGTRRPGAAYMNCVATPRGHYFTVTNFVQLFAFILNRRLGRREIARIRRDLDYYRPITMTEREGPDFERITGMTVEPRPCSKRSPFKMIPWELLLAALERVATRYVSHLYAQRRPNSLLTTCSFSSRRRCLQRALTERGSCHRSLSGVCGQVQRLYAWFQEKPLTYLIFRGTGYL